MVILEWIRPHGKRPTLLVAVGLLIGLGGVGALVGPGSFGGGARIDPIGAATVVMGSLVWSIGSIYSRNAPRPSSGVMMAGIQMLVGGMFVGLIGVARGELTTFRIANVSTHSLLAWVYLLIFGSLIAFTAFVYLLRVSTPARVATYAYVNPVVAVLLGWLLADEAISVRMLVAAAIIVAGVALITAAEGRTPARPKAKRRVVDTEDRELTDDMSVTDSA
jgi:drug/metabolite transporter (DMT)-like permease